MILALSILTLLLAAIISLVTSIQLLYLESLRIRARELPALELFKAEIEERIGLETERGALTFSLVKHCSLGLMGCLLTAIAWQTASALEALAFACVLTFFATITSSYVIPQLVYRKTSGKGLLALAPFFQAVAFLVRPLTWAIEFVQSVFELGGAQDTSGIATAEEHMEAFITAGAEEGILEEGDRELIHSVVAFGDKTAREVMTSRPRIVAIQQDASVEELRKLVITEQFSRIPAFETDIDSITGFVHVRDVFELEDDQRAAKHVRDIMRPIRAVPESKPVTSLLRDMQEEGAHMAVVVDEYGLTAGIVTMEDMVEEIVGEIHDEHEPERDFHQDADGNYVVSGSFDVSRLEDLLDFHSTGETESTTVGGLVTEWMGRVPCVGETVERDGIILTVTSASNRRVDQVKASKTKIKDGNEEEK